jgi:hypothetical protein
MPKPGPSPSCSPTTLRTVLQSVSLRSVFSLNLDERLDRFRLIEAARSAADSEADPELFSELMARRTETVLALVTKPSPSLDQFEEKAALIGPEVTFPGLPKAEFLLLTLACWAPIVADGRSIGAMVEAQLGHRADPADTTTH